MITACSDAIVVVDFETSGISPDHGDRAIEIGAVMLRQGVAVDRFQSLMNPEIRISSFIEEYTGITNRMVQMAPRAADVMRKFAAFIGDMPLVAHNASFDRRFLDAEFRRIGVRRRQEFGCSMLTARRVYPEAPNHKLETLVRYMRLDTDGTFHRALADAEMTAQLWVRMSEDLRARYDLPGTSFELMCGLMRVSKSKIDQYFQQRVNSPRRM